MTKITVLEVSLLQGAKEVKKKIDENHIYGLNGKVPEFTPTFDPSTSVITVKRPFMHYWKKSKKLVIHLEGQPKCWEFKSYPLKKDDGSEVHGHIELDPKSEDYGKVIEDSSEPVIMCQYVTDVFGGLRERMEFVAKFEAKMKAERKSEEKPLSLLWPLIGLFVVSCVCVALEVLGLHGVRI